MKSICVQMLDLRISSDWWRAIVRHFVSVGDRLQIRCWNEESDEIAQAIRYGITHREGNETCIDGVVTAEFIAELLDSPEPTDKSFYNKMTQYFTINVSDGEKLFESAHYGTELYLMLSDEEVDRFNVLMSPYADSFSIGITDVNLH